MSQQYPNPPEMVIDTSKTYTATIDTSEGTITANLFADESPKTVNNFVFLAREGFYDGVIFHRVIKGFVLQGGDPTGTGRGGPGYKFEDELEAAKARGYHKGTLAMANAGPNTNGSQFFIMHSDNNLPPQYAVFGETTDGLDVVDTIGNTATGPDDRPAQDIVIRSVTITES